MNVICSFIAICFLNSEAVKAAVFMYDCCFTLVLYFLILLNANLIEYFSLLNFLLKGHKHLY